MSEKTVYQGKFITVTEEAAGQLTFERAYLKPSVQVIPFTEDGKVLLIKERRLVEGGISRWHFVAGFCDKPGLSPEEVAQEELMEEAGFRADKLVKWHVLNHKHSLIVPITYYLAYGLKPMKKDNPDGPVVEEIKAFTIEELHDRVMAGEFDFLHEASIIMKLWRERKKLTV